MNREKSSQIFHPEQLSHYPVTLFARNHMDSGERRFWDFCTSGPFDDLLPIHSPMIYFPGSHGIGDSVRRERLAFESCKFSVAHSSVFHVVRLQHTVNSDMSKVALLDDAAL